jgi:hypothetical protein
MSAVRGPKINDTLRQTWLERVNRWKTSGLSVRDFCSRENLSEPSFYSWRRTLAQRDAQPTAAPPFIPVHVLPATPPLTLELLLRSGHTLRVPAGFDADQLRAIVAALEAAAC